MNGEPLLEVPDAIKLWTAAPGADVAVGTGIIENIVIMHPFYCTQNVQAEQLFSYGMNIKFDLGGM
ncbi:hypothetical protein MKY96_27785 [Paenibacillus sp. FSL R7-0302]|uniref:hypothetical protein n=1 Tax=Paenibacillus sp. FSL R7-0302 TaxID=2921681 RepID=UPI0030F96F49